MVPLPFISELSSGSLPTCGALYLASEPLHSLGSLGTELPVLTAPLGLVLVDIQREQGSQTPMFRLDRFSRDLSAQPYEVTPPTSQGSSAHEEVLRATRRISGPVAVIQLYRALSDCFQREDRLGQGVTPF